MEGSVWAARGKPEASVQQRVSTDPQSLWKTAHLGTGNPQGPRPPYLFSLVPTNSDLVLHTVVFPEVCNPQTLPVSLCDHALPTPAQ